MKINELLHPEVKKIFYNWLEKNKAREEYQRTVQLIGSLGYESYSLLQIINWSFIWDRTPAGHTYWCELNKKWKQYIRHYLNTHSQFKKWALDNRMNIT